MFVAVCRLRAFRHARSGVFRAHVSSAPGGPNSEAGAATAHPHVYKPPDGFGHRSTPAWSLPWHEGCSLFRQRGGSRAMAWDAVAGQRRLGVEMPPISRRAMLPSSWGPAAQTAHLRGPTHVLSSRNRRKESGGALTAIQTMRYGPASGVCALVARVVILAMRGGGVVQPASARRRVHGESHARQVRGGGENDSRLLRDRLHGEAYCAREGRRVTRASEIGARGSDHRAGSLVRRCKGCRNVVSSRGVPREG